MKWTEEQYKAITTKNCNLLVSAGAGSGKTAVLVERIVGMILNDKVDITNILVVTFTNAAANEMKERILNKLYEKLDETPDDIWLQQQVINMGSANITTIHSFCLSVIKQYYYEIGIEPNLKIANEIDNELMKYEILQEMFDEQYEKEQADLEFLNLQEMFEENNKSDNLKEIILKIYKFAINQPFPNKVYNQLLEVINTEQFTNFEQSIWGKEYINYCVTLINKIIGKLDIILDIVSDDEKQVDFYEKQRQRAKDMLTIQEKTWDEAIKLLRIYTLDRKIQMKGYDEETKKIVDIHWDSVKNMHKSIFCDVLEEDIQKQNQVNRKELTYLINMVVDFDKRFKEKKSKKKVIDFNDFEHYALQILLSVDEEGNVLPSQVAKEYRKKFVEILIDEYQDSNYIQDYILNVISKCDEDMPNIFMVGDVKQSIYKFRGAKPEIFLQKYYTYEVDGESKFKKINLYKNFRSRDGILGYINYIFSKIMTKEVGQLEYTKDEFLNYGADYKIIDTNNYSIELDVITLENEETVEEQEEAEDEEDIKSENVEYEAQFVANRIKQLIKEKYQVLDKKTKEYRDIKYGDIVILLRNTKSIAPIFNQIFKENNVPIYVDNKVGYLDEIEVTEVISFLQIIDNPYQDIPLVATLKSPFGNFDDSELARIRQYDVNGHFYTAMQKASVTNEKVNKFLQSLNKYTNQSKYLSVSQLIWNIYEDYQYIAYMKRYRDYENRKANLILLFERARQFEDSSYKGLFNFINFIFKIKDNNQDMGSATILGENDDVVRLMSIHKSKGLEFPVVFLSNTNKEFNTMDLRSKFLLHEKMLIGNDIIDLDKRISYKSIFKRIMSIKMKQEIVAEEIRMLYVALTRAKEKLIITGVTESVDELTSKAQSFTIDNLKSYLSFMCYAIYQNGYSENLDINYIPNKMIHKANEEESEEDNINLKEMCRENEEKLESGNFDKDKYNDISKQMEHIYQRDYLKKMPHKISVTEIKRISNLQNQDKENTESSMMPKWIIDDTDINEPNAKVTATQRGNIYHYVFQNLDFSKNYTYDELKQDIQNVKKITEEEFKVIDVNKVLNFTKTELYTQMQNADRIYREQTFMLEVNVEELKDVFGIENIDKDENDTILIQGTIDMFYVKGNEAVIVDYKTDRVNDVEEIKNRYMVQLKYYKKALEKILNLNVKKTYIYLVNTNESIEME